jgi:hypothetical protein
MLLYLEVNMFFLLLFIFFFNFNIITLFYHVYLRLELCGGSLHVENSVVIDIPLLENCDWEIQTDNDHILVFDLVHQDLNFEQSKEFLAVWIYLMTISVLVK